MKIAVRPLKIIKNIIFYAVLCSIAVFSLFPIYWVINTSLKIPREFTATPPIYIPTVLTLDNYMDVIERFNATPFLMNSAIIAFGTVIVVLLLSVPAAYAASRYNFGGTKLRTYLMMQRMLPVVVIILPMFLIFIATGLIDTHHGMILPYLIFQVPFAIWMLIGFFSDIPPSLQEAAMVDGCSEFKAVVKVVLPLLKPALVVVVLFVFIAVWNDFLIALTLTRRSTSTFMLLVVTAMEQMPGDFFGRSSAMASLAIIPIFVVTIVLQRHLIRGMMVGGIKE